MVVLANCPFKSPPPVVIMDVPHTNLISYCNTFKVNNIQFLQVGTTMASPVFGYVDHPAMHALVGITAATTVMSAVSYLVSKDTYKFLRKKK